jgi:hypothetical protein
MPRLGERLPIEEILFLELDFRQMLGALLDFHPTCGTGRIPAAIMIERKP